MAHEPQSSNLLDSLAKPPPAPSDLDELMSRDPLSLSSQDIDKIIAMQRQYRARKEAAPVRGRGKAKAEAVPSGIDLVALVKSQAQPAPIAPKPTVSTGGGFRRI